VQFVPQVIIKVCLVVYKVHRCFNFKGRQIVFCCIRRIRESVMKIG
jgi:hypothetical protein